MTANGAAMGAEMAECGNHSRCGGCYSNGSNYGCEECDYTGRVSCACVRGDSEGRARPEDWSHGVATDGTVCHDCAQPVPTGTAVMMLRMPGGAPLVFCGGCTITGIGAPDSLPVIPVA